MAQSGHMHRSYRTRTVPGHAFYSPTLCAVSSVAARPSKLTTWPVLRFAGVLMVLLLAIWALLDMMFTNLNHQRRVARIR